MKIERVTDHAVMLNCVTASHTDIRLKTSLFEERLVPVKQDDITIFKPLDRRLDFQPPERPMRVLILTSIRDVGKSESVGQFIKTSNGLSYVEGTIEYALRAVHQEGRLKNYIEIAGIVTDDLPEDLAGSNYTATPRTEDSWIFPMNLRNAAGELATNLTVNIPSAYRKLPVADRQERSKAKYQFERSLVRAMHHFQADVLLSDHFMGKIENLIHPDRFDLLGRVLNTHPGITNPDDQYRCVGPEPEMHAIAHANGRVRDNKGNWSRAPRHSWTGATFHAITAKIDAGPRLCEAENTPVYNGDLPEELIQRIYATSKNIVFEMGIKHYAAHFFDPNLKLPPV